LVKVLLRLTIEISDSLIERISLHAREESPVEACGILIGTTVNQVRKVTEVWPAKNMLASRSSYEIDPESLFRAFTHAEQNRLEVVGFYHSHPFWSADASQIDKSRANYPALSYLIYSVPNNEARSFYFDGTQLLCESLIVTTAHATTESSLPEN